MEFFNNGNGAALQTKFCWNCGEKLMMQDAFCSNCGAAQNRQSAPAPVVQQPAPVQINPYDELVGWLVRNRLPDEDKYRVMHFLESGSVFSVVYDVEKQRASFDEYRKTQDGKFIYYTSVLFEEGRNDFFVYATCEDVASGKLIFKASGFVDRTTLTANTLLNLNSVESDFEGFDDFGFAMTSISTSVHYVFAFTELILTGQTRSAEDSGLTLADFGFTAFDSNEEFKGF